MPTRLMWKAMEKQREWNKFLGNCPMYYDAQTELFVFTDDFYKLKRYYFDLFFFLAWADGGSALLVLIRHHFYPTEAFSLLYYVAFVCALLLVGLGLGVAISFFLFGEQPIAMYNQHMVYYRKLQQLTGHDNQKGPIWMHDGKPDTLGIVMICLLGLGRVAPYFFATFVIPYRFNPMDWLLEDLMYPHLYKMWQVKALIYIGSWIILFICVAHTTRLISLMMIAIVGPTQTFLMSINMMDEFHSKMKSKRDYLVHHSLYSQLRIINLHQAPMTAPQLFLLGHVGILLSSIVTFGAIKFYPVVPLGFYLIFLVGGFVIYAIIGMIIPYGIRIYDSSYDALHRWRGGVSYSYRVIRKKYKALRPILFYEGLLNFNFNLLENSYKSNYYMAIMDNTVNLLVSVPDEALEKLRVE